MLSSEQLKKIVAEARPLIEQQLDLTEQVAGLREIVTAAGGDWSRLKALVKAQIQDERDEAGDGKRVRKILDKADYAQGYADMLGLAKMNEKNSFAEGADDDLAGLEALDPNLLTMLIDGSKSEAGLAIIRAALAAVQENNEPAPPAEPEVAAATAGEGTDALPADTDEPETATTGEAHEKGAAAGGSPAEENAGGENVAPPNGPTSDTAGAGEGEASPVPGAIRYELTPPVSGMHRHEYLACFPENWGRAHVELKEDILRNGIREPIQRQGDTIIDGWSRFVIGRELMMRYPVQEYAGDDPLRDIITLNMASRSLNLVERQSIAKKLIKLAPDRRADIEELLDLQQQREAAQ